MHLCRSRRSVVELGMSFSWGMWQAWVGAEYLQHTRLQCHRPNATNSKRHIIMHGCGFYHVFNRVPSYEDSGSSAGGNQRSNSIFPGLSSLSLCLLSKSQTLGTWYQVPVPLRRSTCVVPTARYVPGTWYQALVTKCLIPDTYKQAPAT